MPPPYRLTCDLAVLPVALPVAAAQTLAGVPLRSLVGRTLGVLLLARYTGAHFGPAATPYPAPPGDFYREVALALPVSGGPWPALVFARMWIDAADESPHALGHAYGFPKGPAAISWRQSGNALDVSAQTSGPDALALDAVLGPRLPGGWLGPLSGSWAVFPATGLRAAMRLEHTGDATLLRARRLESPALAAASVRMQPLPGLLLRGCVVALGPPGEFQ